VRNRRLAAKVRVVVAGGTLNLQTIFKRSAPFAIRAFIGHVPSAIAFLRSRNGGEVFHIATLIFVEHLPYLKIRVSNVSRAVPYVRRFGVSAALATLPAADLASLHVFRMSLTGE
jgi:hypothetical protein